ATAAARMRQLDLIKPPGVAESIDWAAALSALGARTIDSHVAAATLGAALKYREDIDRVRAAGLAAADGQPLRQAPQPTNASGQPLRQAPRPTNASGQPLRQAPRPTNASGQPLRQAPRLGDEP